MILIHLEPIDQQRGRAVILSETVPEDLTITGADVEDMRDDYTIAEGSILVTPEKYFVAYEDNHFTEQGVEPALP